MKIESHILWLFSRFRPPNEEKVINWGLIIVHIIIIIIIDFGVVGKPTFPIALH